MTANSKADAELLNILIECEKSVWDALVSGDKAADAASLHDSFLGVYPDGFSGKSDHVAQLDGGPTVASYEISQCRVRSLGVSHAVLSYSAVFYRTGAQRPEQMYVSSIWQLTATGWINLFSQDTPAKV